MNRNQAKEILPIIKAFSEGKVIQLKSIDGIWEEVRDNTLFDCDPKLYHIKPEPKYRPFANAEECWQEMQKHQPFGWIKCEESYFNILNVNDYYVGLGDNSSILLASKNSYQDNTFANGTPFGIVE
nr:MAG TPA: hypothetical protein [Caudoviricetes sp.]